MAYTYTPENIAKFYLRAQSRGLLTRGYDVCVRAGLDSQSPSPPRFRLENGAAVVLIRLTADRNNVDAATLPLSF